MPESRGSTTASITMFGFLFQFDIQKAYRNIAFLDIMVLVIIIIPLRLSIVEEGKTTIILNAITFIAAVFQIIGIVFSLFYVLSYQRAPETTFQLNIRIIFLCFFLAEYMIMNSIECLGNKENQLIYTKCTNFTYWIIGYSMMFILECLLILVIKATLQDLDLGSIRSYMRELRRRKQERKAAKLGITLEVQGVKITKKGFKNVIKTNSMPCEFITKNQTVKISLIEKGLLSRRELLSTKASIEPLLIRIQT